MSNILKSIVPARLRALSAAVSLCIIATAVVAGPAEDGLVAYNKGDYATALDLWRQAGNAGNAAAQNNLGIMYDLGKGVQRSDKLALFWFLKAARQGFANAQYNLGRKYDNGEGVEANEVTAYMFFVLAASSGNAAFALTRDKLGKQLSPQQIRTGRKLAREWVAAHKQ